jgi:hypothetical protein
MLDLTCELAQVAYIILTAIIIAKERKLKIVKEKEH